LRKEVAVEGGGDDSLPRGDAITSYEKLQS